MSKTRKSNEEINILQKRIEELEKKELRLKQIEWLLKKEEVPSSSNITTYKPDYGNVTKFNTSRIIIDNIEHKTLEALSEDIMDLLDTSIAVYEKNGDYAYGRFDSTWCQLMDSSSFKLCKTTDTKKALTCGEWLCHENCWNDSAKQAIETGNPTDIECVGGIHLYGEPIQANGKIIGCINIGYGNPPQEEKTLTDLAEKYQIDKNELIRRSKEYKPRPPFIIENAKKRLKTVAILIGQVVENNLNKTKYQKVNEKLERSEELLTETGLMAKVGGWEINLENNTVEWTKTTREIHEVPEDYNPTLEEAVQFFPGEAKEKIENAVRLAIEKGIPYDMVVPFKTAKGKRLWTHTIGKPVFKNGKCMRLHGTFQDVTKRYNTELKLKEQELTFKRTEKIAHVGSWEWDIATDTVTWSDELFKIFKINPKKGAVSYADHPKVYTPDSMKKLDKAVQKTINTGKSYEIDVDIKRGDGKIRHCIAIGHAKKNEKGKVVKLYGSFQDITERKKSELKIKNLNEELAAQNEEYISINEELQQTIQELEIAKERTQESEERFEALHNASFGGIVIHDKGLILECNLGLSELTGFSYEELIGMDGLLLIAEETREQVKQKILSEYEEPYEAIGQRKNGEKYPVRLEARMIPYKGKRVRVVEFRDITLQKENELTIQKINEELITQNEEYENLNEELRQTVEELQKAKEKAEESDRLKSAFLANMSHEIRTPMNGILGFTDLLKKPGLSGEKKEKYVDVIQKSGKRMLNTINDIVEISKIEAGDIKPEPTEININEQLDYYYTFFKPEVDSKGMNLSVKKTLKNNQVNILTDSSMFNSILTNLIKNAIKYSDKGNIEFGYTLTEQENKLEFYVKDTGIGIPREKFDDIFNRFVQVDIGDTRAAQGSGLGLAITKAYVEILGGEIWLESEVDKGSSFYFTLPYTNLLSKKSESKKNQDIESEQEIKKLNILIVEDDEISDIHLSILTECIANEILHVKDGKNAVELCKKRNDFDLILMDIKLPGMNGYIATEEIRKFNSDIIIIAQSAYAMKGDREKALEAGCNDYITKPIDEEELLKTISKYFK